MTKGAEIIPACTAACPITSAPTILTADPTGFGNRTPASLKPSNKNSIISASMTAGNGMPSRAAAILISKFVGINLG
ncbi:Uncharacterised protein [Streptococcus pneumoniae]|nr:Uncharacterised protein [Streptococcus pneumoniae]